MYEVLRPEIGTGKSCAKAMVASVAAAWKKSFAFQTGKAWLKQFTATRSNEFLILGLIRGLLNPSITQGLLLNSSNKFNQT